MRTILIRLLLLFSGLNIQAPSAELLYPPYAVPFMIRPQDPVTAAMGLSGAAYRTGPLSTLTNPAGLSHSDITMLSGVHVPAQGQGLIPENRPQYLNQESIAAGHPFHGFVIGGMFLHYNLGSGSEGQEDGGSSGYHVRLYQFSCARQFNIHEKLVLSAGLNLKRIENKLAHKHGAGYSGDVGFRIQHRSDKRMLMAGLSVCNLGLDFRYKQHLDTEYEIPLHLFRMGVASLFLHPFRFFETEILIALEYQRNLNYDPKYFQNWEVLGGGVECGVFDVLYLRVGKVFDLEKRENAESIEGVTFGAGFHTDIPFKSMPPLHLKLDYGRGLEIQNLNQNMISLTLEYDL